MDRSPYLAQALQAIAQPPQQQQQGISPADVLAMAMQKNAVPAAPGVAQPPAGLGGIQQRLTALPGRIQGNLQQAGANLQALPSRIAAIPGQVSTNVAQLPGLLGLGQHGIR